MANTALQGAYIPQYAHMQTAVPVEVSEWQQCSSLCVKHFIFILQQKLEDNSSGKDLIHALFQENGVQSQVDSSGNHSPYSYQQSK